MHAARALAFGDPVQAEDSKSQPKMSAKEYTSESPKDKREALLRELQRLKHEKGDEEEQQEDDDKDLMGGRISTLEERLNQLVLSPPAKEVKQTSEKPKTKKEQHSEKEDVDSDEEEEEDSDSDSDSEGEETDDEEQNEEEQQEVAEITEQMQMLKLEPASCSKEAEAEKHEESKEEDEESVDEDELLARMKALGFKETGNKKTEVKAEAQEVKAEVKVQEKAKEKRRIDTIDDEELVEQLLRKAVAGQEEAASTQSLWYMKSYIGAATELLCLCTA